MRNAALKGNYQKLAELIKKPHMNAEDFASVAKILRSNTKQLESLITQTLKTEASNEAIESFAGGFLKRLAGLGSGITSWGLALLEPDVVDVGGDLDSWKNPAVKAFLQDAHSNDWKTGLVTFLYGPMSVEVNAPNYNLLRDYNPNKAVVNFLSELAPNKPALIPHKDGTVTPILIDKNGDVYNLAAMKTFGINYSFETGNFYYVDTSKEK